MYIDSTKWGFISLILFIALAFTIPGIGPSEYIKLILTVTTFLFAILAGFFISRASSRYNEMRRSISAEDALFLSLYKTTQNFGKEVSDKMANLIDDYYITSYDNELFAYGYKMTLPYFLKIWDMVNGLKGKLSDVHKHLLKILTNLEGHRNLSSSISKERVGKGQWAVLLSLSAIIWFCLFYMKTDEIYSKMIVVLLSTSIAIILLILRDLENLTYGTEKSLLEESGQEVLESIGKLRYYNQRYLKESRYSIPSIVKKYRVGMHKPGEKFNIKIVKHN